MAHGSYRHAVVATIPRAAAGRWRSSALRASLVLVMGLQHWAAPAFAADAKAISAKAAENMARQAATAFEQGDHLRAAALYRQAFENDPATLDYLYGAARAEQIAGKTDLAEQHFQEFLSHNPSGKRLENAQKYLGEIRVGRAEKKESDAERAEQQGNWALAAALYHAAYDLAPQRPQALFREALARESGGEKGNAERLLRQYLDVAPANAPDREEAGVRLRSFTEPAKPVPAPRPVVAPAQPPVAPPPVPKPQVAVAPPKADVVRPAVPSEKPADRTWLTVSGISAGALGLTAAGLFIAAAISRADLDRLTTVDATTHRIEAISYSEAQARQSSISTLRIAGTIFAGTAAVATAASGWFLWKDKQNREASLLLSPTSVAWEVRF